MNAPLRHSEPFRTVHQGVDRVFLEWVSENPKGVISLPTGKTPEYFIKFTRYLLENWNTGKGKELRKEKGESILNSFFCSLSTF